MSTITASAGNFLMRGVGSSAMGAGVETPWGLLLPPGARVAAYVNSNGTTDGDAPEIRKRTVTTINSALQYCRAGKGDVVMVHPDHTESVSTATFASNLVAGTRIIGMGSHGLRPTLTWTATAGQIAINKANCSIENMNLNFVGIDAVVKAIAVTASGFRFENNYVTVGATSKTLAIGVELGSGADNALIAGNTFNGLAAAVCTDSIVKVAAVVDNPKIVGNVIQGAVTAVAAQEAPVSFTAAATNIYVAYNQITNLRATGATSCIHLKDTAGGLVCYNMCSLHVAATAPTSGINASGSTARCFQNFCSDGTGPGTTGVLIGTPAS
jgi:hypothetical protein